MRLFLIRHAECTHNIGQASGNAANPELTGNGKLQVQLLARHFRNCAIRFTHVFSSDLDRASDTAHGICQQQLGGPLLTPFQTSLLQEQVFGSLEGTRWQSGALASSIGSPGGLRGIEPHYTEEESMASMRSRANTFLFNHILSLIDTQNDSEQDVAIIAHNVILQVLWVCITELVDPRNINMGPGVVQGDFADYVLPTWSNAGYMELDFRPLPPALSALPAQKIASSVPLASNVQPSVGLRDASVPLGNWGITVRSVDNTSHLGGMRTERAALNPAHGSQQQTMDNFYRLTGSA